ncbi:MAG: nucleotidyltransferase domain-containing protein [Nitrososphaerota archaeon]|jgi:predicted nucleotidyltransferase|nr:nucleotidyltransferase domain-containing protein [Nitrososphaerota archaeon]
MANLNLRDRDAIQTKEGIIFRVFGYSHPKTSYICDAEYASAKIFTSKDPRAPREGKELFYKFYNDEGLKLIKQKYEWYLIEHEMLGLNIVGVPENFLASIREPQAGLKKLLANDPTDQLVSAMKQALEVVSNNAGVSWERFGIFGSMLHGFHHPKYSDIDFTIYGKAENKKIVQTLAQLYCDSGSGFSNEFETENVMANKRWLFENFGVKDFVWHQRRKMIYGLYDDRTKSGRIIKAEFEPVKAWEEIRNEYDPKTIITQKGWVRLKARVISDEDAPFIPSVYGIEPLEVLKGPKGAIEAIRIFSYMEEFRQQVQRDETIIVEGSLEEVISPMGSYMQVTLTYCPRYYEQVLKTLH